VTFNKAGIIRNPQRLYRFEYTANNGSVMILYDCGYDGEKYDEFAKVIRIFSRESKTLMRIEGVSDDHVDPNKKLMVTVIEYQVEEAAPEEIPLFTPKIRERKITKGKGRIKERVFA